jgi:hypothetical protein
VEGIVLQNEKRKDHATKLVKQTSTQADKTGPKGEIPWGLSFCGGYGSGRR